MTSLALVLTLASSSPAAIEPPTEKLSTRELAQAPVILIGPTAHKVAQDRPGLPAQRRVRYRWSQVWRAAMRMIRVDRSWSIDDHSQEAGYLLFHDPSTQDGPLRGSIELVAMGEKESGSGLLIRAKVSNAGTHAAFTLLSALEQKLRADFGPPRPTSPPKPEKPKKPAPKEPKEPKEPEAP